MSRRRTMAALAAARQEQQRQQGVEMGYGQNSYFPASTRWESLPIPVGMDDFTIEYYGNFFGSGLGGINTIYNSAQPVGYQKGCLMMYAGELGRNGLAWILFEGSASADGLLVQHAGQDPQKKFHLGITRSGREVKAYINGVLKTTKQQTSVKDFPSFKIGLANSSDIGLYRHFNYALSASDVAALYNNGKPEEKVLPTADKVGCIAEYLPQNIESANGVAKTWLDSAQQLPAHDEYLPPLLQSIGGYDLAANGAPEIIHKPALVQQWQMMEPMTLNKLLSINPTFRPEIVDGALRIKSNGDKNSYAGGGLYAYVINAQVGDSVEVEFEARASVEGFKAHIGPTFTYSLYYARTYTLTTSYQKYSARFNNINNHLDSCWMTKNYEYTTAGTFDIKNITIKIYRK